MKKQSKKKQDTTTVAHVMRRHFGKPIHELSTARRKYPVTARLDLEAALRDFIARQCTRTKAMGFYAQYAYGAQSISSLGSARHMPAQVAPLEFEEVDAGEAIPVRCLKSCLWLAELNGKRVAILLAGVEQRGEAAEW